MAKGFLNRLQALWNLSNDIELEDPKAWVGFTKPKAEFLEPNIVGDILLMKPDATLDDVLLK